MRILLDTNVVIHRENKRVSNYSIGHLFRWIDKLKYDKVIHPYTISEIQKYRDPETQETISVKLESYDVIKTVRQPDTIFLSKIGQPEKNENDHIAIVDEIIENIGSEENLLSLCQNRSVFSVDELKEFWRKHRYNLKILKFIFVKSLSKRLTLGYLWEHNIIAAPGGPRPFTPITDEQFDMIVKDSETEITYVE